MIARESSPTAICLAFASAATIAGCATAAPPPTVLDGRFEDWKDVPDAAVDPADAPDAVVDLGRIRVTHDDRYVHFMLEFGREVNIQKLDGRGLILLDADGDPDTGTRVHDLEGVDVVVELTPPDRRDPSRPGMGLGVQSATWQPDPADPQARPLSPYQLGLAFAPTCAADTVEIRMERGVALPGTPPLLTGPRLHGQVVVLDRRGRVADASPTFAHDLVVPLAMAPVSIDQPRDPLARPRRDVLRVVSWNAEYGAIFDNPAPFARVLRALDPDVILFQELRDEDTAERLHSFVRQAVPKGRWLVLRGDGGGDLRCAVASRLPMSEVPSMRLLPYADRPDRSLRVAAASVEFDGRRVLVASVHLKCCGSVDSREDETRRAEADQLARTIASTMDGSVHGVVVAGDLNLVGGRRPLQILAAGADIDGTTLGVAEPMQLDGRTNATWSDAEQPFVPGRLDYLLYSDHTLGTTGSFVLDTRDLAERWLRRHGMRPDDTATASDHLPVVVDLAWTKGGS